MRIARTAWPPARVSSSRPGPADAAARMRPRSIMACTVWSCRWRALSRAMVAFFSFVRATPACFWAILSFSRRNDGVVGGLLARLLHGSLLAAEGPGQPRQGAAPGEEAATTRALAQASRGLRRHQRPKRSGADTGWGQDRLAVEKATQVVRQLRRRGVAPGRLLMQTLQADCLQVARHGGLQLRRRHGLARVRDLFERFQ